MGRWRLWLEDRLMHTQDFEANPPDGSNQRRDVGYVNPCAKSQSSSAFASTKLTTSPSSSADQTTSSASKISSPPPPPPSSSPSPTSSKPVLGKAVEAGEEASKPADILCMVSADCPKCASDKGRPTCGSEYKAGVCACVA